MSMIAPIILSYGSAGLFFASRKRRASLGAMEAHAQKVRPAIAVAALLCAGLSLLLFIDLMPVETAIPLWCVTLILPALVISLTLSLWPGARSAVLVLAGPIAAALILWSAI